MRQEKIRFVTLFPECSNVGLVKDVGQIPYVLGKNRENVQTALVSSIINLQGPYLEKVEGLQIIKYPYILNKTWLTGFLYLLLHAKEIDWLNIYHCRRQSYYWTKLYKILNPKGKIYLKLDLDFRSCELYETSRRPRNFFTKITGIMDLVSVESNAIKKRIQTYTKCDIKIIRNGYCEPNTGHYINEKRENLFITVGRLGTRQKATEILLEAFAKKSEYHNWNLKLIGSIDSQFEDVRKHFYNKYPNLVNRVIFTGEINDRELLWEEYKRAKVFILPSRWESFAIAGIEALSCGCRIILSDQVPSMHEIVNEGKYGQVVPVDDIDAFAEAMFLETKKVYTNTEIQEMIKYAKANFSWENICSQLYRYLVDL